MSESDKPNIYCDEQGGVFVCNHGFYNKVIPKEKRTRENLANYCIVFQSFYDCAKNAGDEEYIKLTNEEAVINFLLNCGNA